MSQFFVSCKESRIETNRSFYGCFHLGPFEPSQSLTIANTLRRTLLSEIYGLAIVSVEIEGATHEYSSLPGVYESVLDILLNLKEIVLKKSIKNFSPQIGYLRVRGPGVVLASHLRLPPFIQCVDPDQYIANLSHNGFLNMKFVIQYGNKWLSPSNSFAGSYKPEEAKNLRNSVEPEQNDANIGSFNTDADTQQQSQKNLKDVKIQRSISNNVFNFHFKKRRLFIKKLKDFGVSGANSYIDMFSKSFKKLFKYKKKRDIILGDFFKDPGKQKNKKSLHLILKINKQFPGINFKTGSITSNFLRLKAQTSGVPEKKGDTRGGTSRGQSPSKNTKLNTDPSNNKMTGHNNSNGTVKLEQNIEKNINPIKRKDKDKDIVLDQSTKNIQTLENCWNHEAVSYYKDTKLTSKEKSTDLGTKNIKRNLKISHSKLPKRKVFFNVNSLNIDAIFNPILKVNYIIEINDFKVAQNKIQNAFQSSELYETLIGINNLNNNDSLQNFASDEATGSTAKIDQQLKKKKLQVNDWNSNSVSDNVKSRMQNSISTAGGFDIDTASNKNELQNLLKLNQEISSLTKETLKHNIILEIWTNGSMHPRDALYQAFKNLIKIFLKLKNVQPFGVNQLFLKSSHSKNDKKDSSKTKPSALHKQQYKESSNNLLESQRSSSVRKTYNNDISKIDRILLKKVKRGELTNTFVEKLQPLNEASFLSLYINPKIKNYYINKKNLFFLLNSSIGKNFVSPIFITGKLIPEVFTTLE